jgi:hypothetical protein
MFLTPLGERCGQTRISAEGKTTNKEIKMHPEQPECRFCGGCRDENKDYVGWNVQDGEWLEEMGNMVAAAVEGMRKVRSFSDCCHERLAIAKNLSS